MNVYKVSDSECYVFVAAENRRDALDGFPTEYAEHAYLIERDVELKAGDCTFEYQQSRGVDLILSGVIPPNWFSNLHDSDFDDYRSWNGFRKAEVEHD